MFEAWDNFYLMIGSAAGALIGLLFVVASLTGSLGQNQAQEGFRVYLTPTVFHFAIVLTASAITAVPGLDLRIAGGAMVFGGILGLLYSGKVGVMIRHFRNPDPPHWTDKWCYAVMPAGVYVAQVIAATALAMRLAWSPLALAAVLLALLLLSIRNAWDLVTTIAPLAAAQS